MEIFLLIGRMILAGVFGVAGVAKLADREGSEKAIVNFGLPKGTAKPLAILLPLAEIAVAVLLLPLSTAWVGAVGGLVLLLAFIGGIVYNMAQGNAPDCHCFGQIHSEPVGWSVLIRNLVLAAVAVFVAIAGRENAGLSAFAWLSELTTGEKMQLFFNLIFVGLLVAVFVGVRKILANQADLQKRIEIFEITAKFEEVTAKEVERPDVRVPLPGLPVGAVAPDFAAAGLNGREITLEHFLMRGKPLIMFFVSPACQPCQQLLPFIEKWQADFGEKLSFVLVSSGKPNDNQKKFGSFDAGSVLIQGEREIAAAFHSQWTPGAIFINADGTIGSPLATGDRAILDLFEKIKPTFAAATNGHGAQKILLVPPKDYEANLPPAGSPAPDFTLPLLNDGGRKSLSDFRGMKTLLLFWRATCPFCLNMIEDLKNWEERQNEFNLVVVANDEPGIEAAGVLKSPVLVETNLEVQRIYDNDITPSGWIIDEAGNIASDLAGGIENVFALVGYSAKK